MIKKVLSRVLMTLACCAAWFTLSYVADASPDAPPISQSRPVQCSAALQLMAMAAPDWAAQPGIDESWSAWLQTAHRQERRETLSRIHNEMGRLASWAARKPDGLALMAADCAATRPLNLY